MKGVPKSFRISWVIFSALVVFGSLSLTFHQSANPDVAGRYSYNYCFVLMGAFLLASAVALGNTRNAIQQIYRWRYEGILFGFSSVIALGAAEAVIRLNDPLGISYYEEEGRYTREKVADPELLFRHPPSRKTHYQGVEVSFNELGLRDEPIGVKQSNEYRILVLGDSVAFGWGVEQDATFCARVQKILNAQLGRPVRVINTGVGGYSSVQELLFFKGKGVTFQSDTVVLVYTENDTEPYGRQLSDPLRVIEGTILWKSWLYRLASHAYYYGWLGNAIHDTAAVRESVGWQESIGAIRQLRELTEERKIPLILFYFRWRETSLNTALLKDVQQAATPAPVIDIGEWFAGQSPSEYMNSKIDSHPNHRAHKLIAEKMARYLLERSASRGSIF